jgi:hypothetical protein
MEYNLSILFISSLNRNEAEDAVQNLRNEFKEQESNMFEPRRGDVFT